MEESYKKSYRKKFPKGKDWKTPKKNPYGFCGLNESSYHGMETIAISIEKYNELKEKYDTLLENRKSQLLSKIPEDQRVFTKGMTNAVKAQYIEQLQSNVNAGKTDSSRAGTTAKGEFGGYSSHAEWATKDPKGYKEANMTPDSQGIKIGYN